MENAKNPRMLSMKNAKITDKQDKITKTCQNLYFGKFCIINIYLYFLFK